MPGNEGEGGSMPVAYGGAYQAVQKSTGGVATAFVDEAASESSPSLETQPSCTESGRPCMATAIQYLDFLKYEVTTHEFKTITIA